MVAQRSPAGSFGAGLVFVPCAVVRGMPFSPAVAAIMVESVNANAVKARSIRLSFVMLIGTIESPLRHACDAKCGGQTVLGVICSSYGLVRSGMRDRQRVMALTVLYSRDVLRVGLSDGAAVLRVCLPRDGRLRNPPLLQVLHD